MWHACLAVLPGCPFGILFFGIKGNCGALWVGAHAATLLTPVQEAHPGWICLHCGLPVLPPVGFRD